MVGIQVLWPRPAGRDRDTIHAIVPGGGYLNRPFGRRPFFFHPYISSTRTTSTAQRPGSPTERPRQCPRARIPVSTTTARPRCPTPRQSPVIDFLLLHFLYGPTGLSSKRGPVSDTEPLKGDFQSLGPPPQTPSPSSPPSTPSHCASRAYLAPCRLLSVWGQEIFFYISIFYVSIGVLLKSVVESPLPYCPKMSF